VGDPEQNGVAQATALTALATIRRYVRDPVEGMEMLACLGRGGRAHPYGAVLAATGAAGPAPITGRLDHDGVPRDR
jgi:hypothetical protein